MAAKRRMNLYNSVLADDPDRRAEMLASMLGRAEGIWIEPPFYFCYGTHIFVGKGTYINFNCSFIDDGRITIGENVLLGPGVTIATTGHPICPDMREYMYTAPVTIEESVWIGANATICPGLTVGRGSVIGAGSVVTRDIPENCVAAGNPCRVLRRIGKRDRQFYFRDRPVDAEDLAEEASLRKEKNHG